ncbi:MAG: ATP-grasp domain-containing protein, partial [Planctomycetota bacterium]
MKVLVIGAGGREHALAWRLSRSPRVKSIVSCPGNAGLTQLGPCWSGVSPDADPAQLLQHIRRERVDLVVIGPEAPLVAGLGDFLREAGVPTFGPSRAASRLEGSKAHAKRFMKRHGIPTAPFQIVQQSTELAGALKQFPGPAVVKADGLAAGKGVILTANTQEADQAARSMLDGGRFGNAGRTVVLEERLEGIEVTMLVFVSGRDYALLESAQDYKPLEAGNKGPNTGGMGAYSPTRLLSQGLRQRMVQ